MTKTLTYWDTSIFDQVAKLAAPSSFFSDVIEKSFLAYSYDNIDEFIRGDDTIVASRLEIIKGLPNRFILLSYSHDTYSTEFLSFSDVDPHLIAKKAYEGQHLKPIGSFGFADIFQKLMGGLGQEDSTILHQEAAENFSHLLEALQTDIEQMGVVVDTDLLLTAAAGHFEHSASEVFGFIRNDRFETVESLQSQLGIDTKVINNFVGPKAIVKLLAYIDESLSTHDDKCISDLLLAGLPRQRQFNAANPLYVPEIIDMVQMLNMIGYYRESKLVKEQPRARRDFVGAQSDASHIANAALCNDFFTGDKKQAFQAAAIYDHLGIQTNVWHSHPNTGVISNVHSCSE